MNKNYKKKNAKNGESEKMRTAFPKVCKWFEAETGEPNTEQAVSEVKQRFQRLQESGTSPCEGCPLCPEH